MALRQNLVRNGMAVNMANAVLGLSNRGATALTATGTTVADALAVDPGEGVYVFGTVAASTGALLPIMEIGDEVYITNSGANALKVYPAEAKVGSAGAVSGANFNGGTTDAAISVVALKTLFVKKLSATLYVAFLSA